MRDAERIAQLEEEVAYLRRELGEAIAASQVDLLRRHLVLERAQARVLLRLYNAKGRVVTRAQLADLLEPTEWSYNNISVHVLRLRRRLGKDGVATARGAGYRLTPAGLALVTRLLAPALQDVAA